MSKKIRTLFALVFSLILLVSITPIRANAAESDFQVDAKAAISVDYETGKILYNQNADTPLGIASITKIIGLYLVEEQVKEGKLAWDDTVEISDYAEELSVTPDLSNVPLHKENQYTVKELFDSAVIQSANASMVALAEKISGSESKFVDLMKEKLKSWGITDAVLVNASGLNNSYLGEHLYPGSSADAENTLSAKDVAIVARHLLIDFPDFLEVSKTTTKMFGENTQSPVEMVNWNWMLPGFINAKEGVDGLKTGTTELAGACFVGTMEKDGRRVITVVLNVAGHEENPSVRFIETGKLMDYSFENWSLEEVSTADATIPDQKTIAVTDGKELKAPIVLKDSVKAWVRKDMDQTQTTIQPTFDKKLVDKETITAPVAKDQTIGTATLQLTQDTLGYLDDAQLPTTDIIVNSNVEKANFFVLTGRKIATFFSNLF
ncbi:serine hydrolase [Enterococcus sp. JM9B]|uniref:serine hydrolase n=1 Tax=Enterococcus sp. JM9B TaxID=1857216 RepID=UPI001374C3FD|nr:serine hydrolase [Enterococcus sp. JM9B]KAF1304875.1 D-alanyl-D-alanine carboxypeptidase [Enterococcus sp. JM9B]